MSITARDVQKFQQREKSIKANSRKVLSGDVNCLEKLYGKNGCNFFSVNCLKFNFLVCSGWKRFNN